MAQTNDTIDGLLAEFRGYSSGMPASYHVTMSWHDFRVMLDRLEAAHRREVQDALDAGGFVEASRKNKQVGNAAKLREALKLCMDEMCNRCRDLASARGNPLPCLQGCEPVRKAKAALAAPPRNCDRYATAEEACQAWLDDAGNWDEFGSPKLELHEWLFAPATEKEGGANG